MSVRSWAATVVAGSFDIGVQAGAQGTVNVNGGTLQVEGVLTVGDGGTGNLTVSDNGTVTSQDGDIGTGGGNNGTVTVDGLGSSWSMSGNLQIGVQGGAGTTSLTVSNQASVTTSPTDANDYDKLFSGTLTLESGGQFTESRSGHARCGDAQR